MPIAIKYTTAASTFVPGARAAAAILRGGRRQEIHKVYMADSSSGRPVVSKQLRELKVPRSSIDNTTMARMLQTLSMPNAVTDGILLECSPIPQLPVNFLKTANTEEHAFEVEVSAQSKEDQRINGTESRISTTGRAGRFPLVLWLHGVVDTGNIAGLFRSAVFYGVDAIALSLRATGNVPQPNNSKNMRAAAGAAEYIPTLTVDNVDTFITKSQQHGWKFISTVPSDISEKLADPSLHRETLAESPCVLILGNEDEGLPRRMVRSTDAKITIAGNTKLAKRAGIESLNVGVAGGVILNAMLGRQASTAIVEEKEEPTASTTTSGDFLITEEGEEPLW